MRKKSMYGFPPPSVRSELEGNLYLVVEDVYRKVDSGNKELIQNLQWATIPHLKLVKKLPNGRVNLATVNEMIRLQANSMRWRDDE